jgi:hypothetical protein
LFAPGIDSHNFKRGSAAHSRKSGDYTDNSIDDEAAVGSRGVMLFEVSFTAQPSRAKRRSSINERNIIRVQINKDVYLEFHFP